MHLPAIQSLLTPLVSAWLSTLKPPASNIKTGACMQTCVQAPADIGCILAEISLLCSWWALQKIKPEKCSDTTVLWALVEALTCSLGRCLTGRFTWCYLESRHCHLQLKTECWWPACCGFVANKSPNAPGSTEKSKAARKTSSHLINNALLKLVTRRKPVMTNLSFNTCCYFK